MLPTFLTSTLGAPASALGLIEGVSDGLAGAARFGGGALASAPRTAIQPPERQRGGAEAPPLSITARAPRGQTFKPP